MRPRSTSLWMVPLLGLVAIVQSAVGPRLAVAGVRPDLVLLFVVGRTLVYGSRDGILWGFAGGLWMDTLSGGPMGASSLALMAAALATGWGHSAVFRRNGIVPTTAAILGTAVYSLSYLGILALVGHPLPLGAVLRGLVLPAMVYNGVLMLFCTPWLNRVPEQPDFA